MAQEIVVYTPVEHALYHSPYLFPILCAAFFFLIVTVVATKLIQNLFVGRYYYSRWKSLLFDFGGVALGALVGLWVFFEMV